jgi:hypothetical protein
MIGVIFLVTTAEIGVALIILSDTLANPVNKTKFAIAGSCMCAVGLFAGIVGLFGCHK